MSDRERESDDDRSGGESASSDGRPPRRSVADQDRTARKSGPDGPRTSGPAGAGESNEPRPAESPGGDDDRERPPPPPIDREHPALENVVFFLLGVLVTVATLAQLLGVAI